MINYFEYNGKKSSDMGLTITNETEFVSPERDIEFLEIPGRDGDIAIDRERFKSFVYPIQTYFKPVNDIDLEIHKISEWLKTEIIYKPLFLSWDPDYIYTAMFYEQFEIVATLKKFGKLPLKFKCQPIRHRLDGSNPIVLLSGQTMVNTQKRTAKPIIKITGNGDITLKNNGVDWLMLINVDESIIIDSETMSVYKGITPHFQKMKSHLSPLFPVLKSGNNTITWTGNVTKVEITPRWEAIV